MLRSRFVIPVLIFVLASLPACSSSSSIMDEYSPDGLVAIVDSDSISTEEFVIHYERTSGNSGIVTDTLSALGDFLDRYVDFRVKVLEARANGYDEDPGIKTEIEQYRLQLARPYIMERNIFEPLVKEMYERRSEAVSARHILITLAPTALPADTMAVFNRITAIRDSVLAGADFGVMAGLHSEDPSAKGAPGSPGYQGDLGYFGGGRMVEEFEDTAFATPVGEVSKPFRTQFGYHILQVRDRIRMPSDRELAHIMIRPRGNAASDVADMDQRVSRVAARLEAGEDFGELAKELSDDQNSAPNAGHIGFVTYDAGLPFNFRNAAFSIPEAGSHTGPITSPFGQHFIQFISENDLGTYEEEYEALKDRVNQMPRAQKAEKLFAAQVRKELETWVDSSRVYRWAGTMSADSLIRMLASGSIDAEDGAAEFIRIGDKSLTVSEFAAYFSSGRLPQATGTDDRIFAVVDQYLDEQAISYRVEKLEESDEEFSRTMQDFRDGLILFKYMEDHIWSAASTDTTGLLNHFEQNRDQYQYPDRIRVVSYSSTSEDGMSSFIETLRNSDLEAALRSAYSDSSYALRTDTTYVSEVTGSLFDAAFDLQEGEISESTSYNQGWIALYHAGVDLARPMTFEEARSSTVSDYQMIVESEILAGLRAKYGVEVFPANLRDVILSPPETESSNAEALN